MHKILERKHFRSEDSKKVLILKSLKSKEAFSLFFWANKPFLRRRRVFDLKSPMEVVIQINRILLKRFEVAS